MRDRRRFSVAVGVCLGCKAILQTASQKFKSGPKAIRTNSSIHCFSQLTASICAVGYLTATSTVSLVCRLRYCAGLGMEFIGVRHVLRPEAPRKHSPGFSRALAWVTRQKCVSPVGARETGIGRSPRSRAFISF